MWLKSFALALVSAITFPQLANCDESVNRSAEMQVLDRFVGTWDLIVTAKPRDGEVTTGKTSETRRWSLGNQYVLFENPHAEKPDDPHFHMLVTYDPAKRNYPGVMMVGASRSFVTGTWDQENSTMIFNGNSPEDGISYIVSIRFIDKDHCESTGALKDANGEVFLELTQKQTRRGK